MANYKVVDADKLDADLTAVADAIRERAGTTEELSFPDGFSKVVADIPGDAAAELVFETEFTVDETILSADAVDVETIDTGLTADDFEEGCSYLMVARCIDDTEEDVSFPHFKERTQIFVSTGRSTMNAGTSSGICFSKAKETSIVQCYYGTSYGLYAYGIGSYCSNIRLAARFSSTTVYWGAVVSGTYKIMLYKMNNSYFGIEGMQ